MSRTRPRLLVLVTLAEVGGAQTYVRDLLPALVEEFDVTVAAHGPGPLEQAAETAGARFVSLRHVRRPISPLRDLAGLLELLRLIRRLRPDIVHANSSKAGVLGRLAAWLAGVPMRLFTVHGWAFKADTGAWSRRAYLWADRVMRPLTTVTICVSQTELEAGLHAGTCDRARAVVIPNGVDPSRFQPALGGHDAVGIVFVGRLAPPKDPLLLVRAIAGLEGRVRLVFVGDGPQREEIERERDRLGLDGSVEITGTRDDVPTLLSEFDVFALTSRSEGMPISVLEGMAAGLPVVASDVGGLREIVRDGETGFLVPAGDAPTLQDRLRALVTDAELRRTFGEHGRRRVEVEFSTARCRERHLALYRELLASKRR